MRRLATRSGRWVVGVCRREWVRVAAVAAALALLVVIGASGVLVRGRSPVQSARAAAVARAHADHAALLDGQPGAWTAEQLGRRASLLPGTELLTVTGHSTGWPSGIQLVIRVVGHSRAEPGVTAAVCFNLRFGLRFTSGVRTVPCPDTQPLRYPALPPLTVPAGPDARP